MQQVSNHNKELAERLKKGERIVKLVALYSYTYVDHLVKHGIRHLKSTDQLVVEVTKDYVSFEGMVGLYESHFVLEESDRFNRKLLNVPCEAGGIRYWSFRSPGFAPNAGLRLRLGQRRGSRMRVRWKYNRFGHVEVWDESDPTPRESDLYLQAEEDVEAFFDSIGMSTGDVNIDDWDYAEIESGWFGDNYEHK